MRPKSAIVDPAHNRSYSEYSSTNGSTKLERPCSSFTTRNKVLKSSSSAYQTWLRRSNEYNSSRLISPHPREYKSIETFNLRSGCQVTKSAGQLRVRIDPDEFFDPKLLKPKEPPMKIRDMEMLIQDLKEQVKYLTVYLEEEQLHHAGTKKRAQVDIEKTKAEMQKQHGEEIQRVLKNHMGFVEDLKKEHAQQMQELEEDLKKQYEKLEKEYKMLQASFKNYRSKISDEMADKWRNKEKEIEWEKQRAVDSAVDNMRHVMEERFSAERAEIRAEYKESMQQLINDQTKEMEEFMRKMGDGKSSMEELKKKADKAEALEQSLVETKEKLRTTNRDLKKALNDLRETQASLAVYEQKFEEKVAGVEDKYRKRIDDLVQELSEIRIKLINKAETLYHERFMSEELQKKQTKYAKEKLEEKILAAQHKNDKEHAMKETYVQNHRDQAGDLTKSELVIEDLRSCGDHSYVSQPPQHKDSARVSAESQTNGIHVSFRNITLDNTDPTPKTFSLPPRKYKSKKLDKEEQGSEELAALTLAGPDKVRPCLPMTTVSLLDTANLPYLDSGNNFDNDAQDLNSKSQEPNLSRAQSPDVIF